MSLLETLLRSNGGDVVKQAGQRLGLGGADTEALLRRIVPALTGGIQQNLSKPGGLEGLIGALSTGQHGRYVDDPATLEQPSTIADGNAILGHLFGSKDVSRNVAAQASADTGIDTGVIKKLLPIVAAVAMGALSKQTSGGKALSGGAGGLLGSLLGGGDGQALDALRSLGKRLF